METYKIVTESIRSDSDYEVIQIPEILNEVNRVLKDILAAYQPGPVARSSAQTSYLGIEVSQDYVNINYDYYIEKKVPLTPKELTEKISQLKSKIALGKKAEQELLLLQS